MAGPGLEGFDAARLAAANIHPVTGLATDYLNHFNEAAMLIEMMGDMPELAPDLLSWRPLSYAEHFQVSGFRDRELAVAAFEAAPAAVRGQFEAASASVSDLILDFQAQIAAGAAVFSEAPDLAAMLYAMIADIAAIIEGESGSSAQDEIDALFG